MYNHHAHTVFLILSISCTNIKHELKVCTFIITPGDNVGVIKGDMNAIINLST